MSALAIHLLGRPRIEQDGRPLPAPRGYKAWGLLAYTLCGERPPSRDELVTLLFGEADDPFAALRWNLNALRRALPGAEVGGDPLVIRLPEGSWLDVDATGSGSWREALAVPGLERELLEGMAFAGSPAFEIWLLTRRRHLGAVAEGVLREAALARLGAGDAPGAVQLAGRLVQINPLDESFQALFVRTLAAAGDGVAAARQVARCRELFRRELGIEPSPALAAAGEAFTASVTSAPVSGRAAAAAQLEAGQAAIAAGVLEAGLQCLRRAVADAGAAGAADVQASALIALGAALVHAARGRDEEAAAALHEALAVAGPAGLPSVAAAASRELGYVEFLRGRYDRAEVWLLRAVEAADDDAAERGRSLCVLGTAHTDTARYAEGRAQLEEGLELSRGAGDARQVAHTLSMLGRLHLLRGDLAGAEPVLDASLEAARAESWTAFAPWPDALRGDVDLLRGDLDGAVARYERAFALGCQLGDPCWEGAAGRGLGLVAAARGDVEQAERRLIDARQRGRRLPDAWVWIEAYTLESLCAVGVAHGLPGAAVWAEELAELTARHGMRALAVRAYEHLARLGDRSASTAARVLSAAIEDPSPQTPPASAPAGAAAQPA